MHAIKEALTEMVNFQVLVTKRDEEVSAEGIQFMRDNRKQIVRARREVILSAGAINSPQLLMLSGIGPREHLEELNIPVLRDLKVGKVDCTGKRTDPSICFNRFRSDTIFKITSVLEGSHF